MWTMRLVRAPLAHTSLNCKWHVAGWYYAANLSVWWKYLHVLVAVTADAIIQTALRESTWFRGSTRIIIAHRIRTIEDSDVILVLDQGNVDETGPPNELRRRKGRFSEMLEISDQ